MLRAVIVDDESDAIESIRILLDDYFPNIQVVAFGQSVAEGHRIIMENDPDIVFLDIQMPDGTGFDLLEKIPNPTFRVIFITAYNQFAIKAFKYSALDYLLKPVDIDEFVTAVRRMEGMGTQRGVDRQIATLIENMSKERFEKVGLATSEGLEFVKIADIILVQAEGSYSTLKLVDNGELMVSKGLGEIEQLLEGHQFYRPHQSHLINIQYVKRIARNASEIVMEDGSIAYLSRRKKNQFMELIAELADTKK